jgi:predicted dehydrogenase
LQIPNLLPRFPRHREYNPFEGQPLDFAEAVAQARPPEVDGREGLRNVELLERIASSS